MNFNLKRLGAGNFSINGSATAATFNEIGNGNAFVGVGKLRCTAHLLQCRTDIHF